MENYDHSIRPGLLILFLYAPVQDHTFEEFIFELDASSYSFKITCIMLRQVISLKNMLVSSTKFTILISWFPICIPLILINEIGKYLSCNNA